MSGLQSIINVATGLSNKDSQSQELKISNNEKERFNKLFESAEKSYNSSFDKVSQEHVKSQVKDDKSYEIKDNEYEKYKLQQEPEAKDDLEVKEKQPETKKETSFEKECEKEDLTQNEENQTKDSENLEKTEEKHEKHEKQEKQEENKENKEVTDKEQEKTDKKSTTQQTKVTSKVIIADSNLINTIKVDVQVAKTSEVVATKKAPVNLQQQAKNQQKVKPEVQAKAKTATNSETVQNTAKQATKNENIAVQVAKDQKVDLKFDNKEQASKIKNKQAIAEDLKPQITKVEVSQDSSANLSQNNTKQDTKGQNQAVKLSVSSMNNNDSTLAKMHFEKIASFDKAMSAKQPLPNEKTVMGQVSEKLSQLNEGSSKVSIILRPEQLGKVSIELVTKKGALTAQITAESNQAKDILAKNIESLKQSLGEQGVNVNNLTVKVQEPSQTENQTNSQFEQKFNQANEQNMANSNQNSNNSNQASDSSNADNTEGTDLNGLESEELVENAQQESGDHDGMVDFRA